MEVTHIIEAAAFTESVLFHLPKRWLVYWFWRPGQVLCKLDYSPFIFFEQEPLHPKLMSYSLHLLHVLPFGSIPLLDPIDILCIEGTAPPHRLSQGESLIEIADQDHVIADGLTNITNRDNVFGQDLPADPDL
jgi:hypothetical protein